MVSEVLCRICTVVMYPRQHVLDGADVDHELLGIDHTDRTDHTDHTDQGYICPEGSRS